MTSPVSMFMVLSSWQSHCESSPGSFDECRLAPSSRRPSNQANRLGLLIRLQAAIVRIHYYYYSARKSILILMFRGGWKAESS